MPRRRTGARSSSSAAKLGWAGVPRGQLLHALVQCFGLCAAVAVLCAACAVLAACATLVLDDVSFGSTTDAGAEATSPPVSRHDADTMREMALTPLSPHELQLDAVPKPAAVAKPSAAPAAPAPAGPPCVTYKAPCGEDAWVEANVVSRKQWPTNCPSRQACQPGIFVELGAGATP